MSALAGLVGLVTFVMGFFVFIIAVCVIVCIFRINRNARLIREHLDFIAPAMRAYWKHQGFTFEWDRITSSPDAPPVGEAR
jgi:hypothetical protein